MLKKDKAPTPEQLLLAANFRKGLEEGKATPGQIATACRITEQAVSNWKRTGKIARHHLPLVAAAFGWSVNQLLTGEPDAVKPEDMHLSVQEMEMLKAFRDLPADDQDYLGNEIKSRAQKSRDYVAKILKEKYGINNYASDEKVAAAFANAPKDKKQEKKDEKSES